MTYLTVKNWTTFQHYRDRKPKWIKLHKDLLDDKAYMNLPLISMALAPCIWLLASEDDGQIPDDIKAMAWRFRQPEKVIAAAVEGLLKAGFLSGREQPASKPLANGYQEASPELREELREDTENREKNTSDDDFLTWYAAYFKHEKKQEALPAWEKLNPEEKAKALQTVKAWCQWKTQTSTRKYWPLPASWLNGKRFDDEIPLEPAKFCTRCGKEPRRPDSDMGDNCWKDLGLGGGDE